MSLSGKNALITGSTSGIGLAIAEVSVLKSFGLISSFMKLFESSGEKWGEHHAKWFRRCRPDK